MPAVALGAMAIGGSVVGGIMGKKGADAQAQASIEAQRIATAEQRRQYDTTRQDQMPWITAGQGAITNLAQLTGPNGALMRDFTLNDFQADPGYDFRLQEAQKALDRSAAARGGVMTGAHLKDITRFGQDYASNEFGNAYNRFQTNRQTKYNMLAGVAGIGQGSANTVANAGMNSANNISNIAMQTGANVGNARAAGYAAIGNAINGGINNGMNWYLMNRATSNGPMYGGSF